MRVDFDYLLQQVKAGKIKRPWRGMSARQFKKHGRRCFDNDDIFILATNAKVGDIYHEHEQNHRICDIRMPDVRSDLNYSRWDTIAIDSRRVNGHGDFCDRTARRGQAKVVGYIVNEVGEGICGCDVLRLPVSLEKAAELELINCLFLFDIDRFRDLYKKLGWFETENQFQSQYDEYKDSRDDPGFALYVGWAKMVVRKYDEEGPASIVDEDGVLLQSYREIKSDIWAMCFSTKEEK